MLTGEDLERRCELEEMWAGEDVEWRRRGVKGMRRVGEDLNWRICGVGEDLNWRICGVGGDLNRIRFGVGEENMWSGKRFEVEKM